MKIGLTAEKPVPAPAANTTPAPAEVAKGAPAPGGERHPPKADASAKIAISSEATNLLSNDSNADFDAEKVNRISDAIAKGTFKINPEAIADKLIANAKEVLTKT